MKKLLIALLAISLSCFAEMIAVEGGTFSMGSATGAYDEKPVHSVTLNSFFIGKYEVTQGEWIATMGTNENIAGDLNLPVETISWYQILVYCNTRSIAESLTPCYTISGSTNPTDWGIVPTSSKPAWNAATCNFTANGYRLPTEAEWEFAARGGNNTVFRKYAGSNYADEVAWYNLNSAMTTHLVGSKQPNELGLYDMSGNVWEFTWDWKGAYTAADQTNPTGPATGTYRVFRGGSWGGYDYWCGVSYRNGNYPYEGRPYDGFRLTRSSELNDIEVSGVLKSEINLLSNYPNPFNPSTTISFLNTISGKVDLTVYNAKGDVVKNLIKNSSLPAGQQSVNFNAEGLNSGVYYYTLQTPAKTITKKMILIK